MTNSCPTKKLGEVAKVNPEKITEVFASNPPVQAETIIKEHYIGLWLRVSGRVQSIDLMSKYITFNFLDKSGVYICANFFRPVDSEVSAINKGMTISVIGQVFNASENAVILDYCQLDDGSGYFLSEPDGDKDVKSHNLHDAILVSEKDTKQNWWEKTWIQAIMVLGAVTGIASFIIYILNANG